MMILTQTDGVTVWTSKPVSTRFLLVNRRHRGISGNSLTRDSGCRPGQSSLEGIGLGDMVLGWFEDDHDTGLPI